MITWRWRLLRRRRGSRRRAARRRRSRFIISVCARGKAGERRGSRCLRRRKKRVCVLRRDLRGGGGDLLCCRRGCTERASMNRPRYDVPPELTNLLLEFTVNVMIERPSDLVEYAARYFAGLRDERQRSGSSGRPPAIAENDEAIYSDEDEPMPPPTAKFARRKSVFAEHYDPAEDDEDEGPKVVYPKSDAQREKLAQAVKNILLFKSLDQNQMQEVIDAMFERKVKAGEVVIKQGDDGDNFYVIASGTYNIFVNGGEKQPDKLVGKYENSGSFGELALMYNMPRAATITAVTEGALWAMNRQTFRRIVLKSAFKKRKEYENLLEKVPMLKSLNAYERMNLCDALMPRAYRDGDLIIMQGDAADGMYFIEDGTVRITVKKDGGSEMEVSRVGKGGYFGELALLTKKPRAASVYASGVVKLAFLDVSAFERLLGPCKEIMMRNIDQYEEQMIQAFGSKANVSDLR